MEEEEPDSYTQLLFERHLGPPKQLPDVLRGSESSEKAAWREVEECRFKVARGRAFDYQGVPGQGALLGLTYHPPRPPQPSPRPASQQPSTAVQSPAHATLWALVQPSASVGINTAVNVVDSPTCSGFAGWRQEAFVDLTKRASIEYSVVGHPSSGIAAELDVLATLPKVPLLPRLTAHHTLAVAEASPGLQHSSKVSMSLLGGAAVVRAQLQEARSEAGPAGSMLTFEVVGQSRRSRGLAGGVKLSPAASSAFYGPGPAQGAAGSSDCGSDSDGEGSGGSSSSSSKGKADRVPGLRLQMQPAAMSSWADLSGRWRQPWGRRLKSTLGYQAQQRRWNLELCQKLGASLTATGSLAWEGPAALLPLREAAEDDAEAGSSSSVAQELLAHARSYAAGSRLKRAGVKLACRLPRQAGSQQKRQVQLESSYDAETGSATHGVRLQLSKRGGSGEEYLQHHRRYDLGVQARPQQRQLDVTFDVFLPF